MFIFIDIDKIFSFYGVINWKWVLLKNYIDYDNYCIKIYFKY